MNEKSVTRGRLRARIGNWAVVLTGVLESLLATGAALYGLTAGQADHIAMPDAGSPQSGGAGSATKNATQAQTPTPTPHSSNSAPSAGTTSNPYATSGVGAGADAGRAHARTQGS